MNNGFERYIHHDCEVWVKSDMKGKHRERCLCYSCKSFKPGSDENCPIASVVYAACCDLHIVTPVWECPEFIFDESKADLQISEYDSSIETVDNIIGFSIEEHYAEEDIDQQLDESLEQ